MISGMPWKARERRTHELVEEIPAKVSHVADIPVPVVIVLNSLNLINRLQRRFPVGRFGIGANPASSISIAAKHPRRIILQLVN